MLVKDLILGDRGRQILTKTNTAPLVCNITFLVEEHAIYIIIIINVNYKDTCLTVLLLGYLVIKE